VKNDDRQDESSRSDPAGDDGGPARGPTFLWWETRPARSPLQSCWQGVSAEGRRRGFRFVAEELHIAAERGSREIFQRVAVAVV